MKIDDSTIKILKNFSTINQSLLFRVGNTLRTVSKTKSTFAIAKVKEYFPIEFGIYDLPRFIGVISLFNSSELTFQDKYCTIGTETNHVKYTYASIDTFTVAPKEDLKLKETVISFELKEKALADILKALSVLQLTELAVVGDGDNIILKGVNLSNPSGDTYNLVLGKTLVKCNILYSADKLKFLSSDYTVNISQNGIAHLYKPDLDYFISCEDRSTLVS